MLYYTAKGGRGRHLKPYGLSLRTFIRLNQFLFLFKQCIAAEKPSPPCRLGAAGPAVRRKCCIQFSSFAFQWRFLIPCSPC